MEKYLPKNLTKKDKQTYKNELIKSKKMYKKNKYYTRKKVKSFNSKTSNHIITAKKMYGIKNILPNKELSNKTKCSVKTLKKIVNKGMGAYFSSGSRPNQTPTPWGLARLASAITGQKASIIDYNIIENGCSNNSTAYKMANEAVKKYGKTLKNSINNKNHRKFR